MTHPSDSGADEDRFELRRFVDAQQGVHEQALAELKAGRKRSHWMWFVFPQVAGLGISPTTMRYAIRSLAEAQAYLRHPLLGPRLVACAQALLQVQGRSAEEILGYPDVLKLKSSMTLFAALPDADPVFAAVLARYYGGGRDDRTLRLIGLAGG
ncbi:DUF1810 domain-containing protein [Thauera sinica]|uniref:DUF1810 domain-containing protein n=1 Tax=Thauera sinica TaxID=2665146 RepID=A0ABW1AM90_9RHOO|nr:DUF1810 domain-containing protein [Thauera sp. K11]ATE59223.1 calpastatin [Thauera sp. K11]